LPNDIGVIGTDTLLLTSPYETGEVHPRPRIMIVDNVHLTDETTKGEEKLDGETGGKKKDVLPGLVGPVPRYRVYIRIGLFG
jgi:hypothetical protein